jgi:hypothetical protein
MSVASYPRKARRGLAHGLAILLAVASWGLAAYATLAGLIVGALRCDESCNTGIGGWSDDPDAWQWKAIVAGAVVVFVAGTAFLVFVCRGNRLRALAAAVLGGGLVVAGCATLGLPQHLFEASYTYAFLAGIVCPLGALALMRSRRT